MKQRKIWSKNKNSLDLKLEDLKVNPDNPRGREKNIKELMDSMSSVGQISPITVDEYGFILSGHRRFEAARRLNWTSILGDVKVDLSAFEKKAIILSANTTQQAFNTWECREFISNLYWNEFLEEYEQRSHKDNGYSEFARRIGASSTTVSKIIRASLPENRELVKKLRKKNLDTKMVDMIVAAPVGKKAMLSEFAEKRIKEHGMLNRAKTRGMLQAYSRHLTAKAQGGMKKQQFQFLLSQLEIFSLELSEESKAIMTVEQRENIKEFVKKLWDIWK